MPTAYSLLILVASLLAPSSAWTGEASPSADAVAQIRALRAQSNASIAAHDADAAVAPLHAEARILGSGGGLIEGAAAMRAAFAASFANPEFVTYVRSPATVEIGHDGTIAAESGQWRATWRAATGERTVSGTYLATWRSFDGQWKIAAEQYIPLACSGGSGCPRR